MPAKSKPPTPKTITVKLHKKIGGYGVTDGKKWHFYAYKLLADAEKIAGQIRDRGERCIAVNVVRDEPHQLIDALPSK